jgi:hypothetical protein
MATEFTLDARQVRAAGKAFKASLPRAVRLALARELRTIGKELALAAIAAADFEVDPKAVQVRTVGPSVRIKLVAVEDKPHHGKALAFENDGKPGNFRHPVFGNRNAWANSRARPFLTPTVEAAYSATVDKIGEAVEKALNAAI